MALQAAAEKRAGLLVPTANGPEAAVVEGLNVYLIGSTAGAVGTSLRPGRCGPSIQSRSRRGFSPALA